MPGSLVVTKVAESAHASGEQASFYRGQPLLEQAFQKATAKLDDDPDTVGEQRYQQAMLAANEAVAAYQSALQLAAEEGGKWRSLSFTRRERSLWQTSLKALADVPTASQWYNQAAEKKVLYNRLLATAEGKIAQADKVFLTDIIQSAGIEPGRVHITLCQIPSSELVADVVPDQAVSTANHDAPTHDSVTRNQSLTLAGLLTPDGQVDPQQCRHHQGDQLMASPASLIKLPIAIVLLHKITAEDIDLDSELFIESGNFTENAAGATVATGESYTLREVMADMIKTSNNIATNQLIDYLKRDYLGQTLAEMGYSKTVIDHKLVGDRMMPSNPGSRANQSTTNDITVMMARAYGMDAPQDSELLDALISQQDQELGYAALKDLNPAISWLGEKTGQNNRMLGSTLAMKVNAERYALTVAIDYGGDPQNIQQIVRQIASYLLEVGPLVGEAEP